MNNDLISRSVLIEEIRERMLDEDEIMHELDREYNKGLLRAIKCVKRVPVVDAEPVRHGRWKRIDSSIYKPAICSCCGASQFIDNNYCPNCGAKMDGKDGDNGV